MTDQTIYEELRHSLMRFAASLVGPQKAADLVSEVMVSTLQKHTLSSLENPKAYLMQSVANRARSSYRRDSRESAALSRLPDPNQAPDPALVSADLDLQRTVAALPPQQRAAIYLIYWEDMTPTDAAELIGVRPATFRRYLHLAHKKLRSHLDE